MSDLQRPPPQSAIQATGQVATDVVGGLKNQPALLAIVVLNVVMIVVAAWFLHQLAGAARENRESIIKLLDKCMDTGSGRLRNYNRDRESMMLHPSMTVVDGRAE